MLTIALRIRTGLLPLFLALSGALLACDESDHPVSEERGTEEQASPSLMPQPAPSLIDDSQSRSNEAPSSDEDLNEPTPEVLVPPRNIEMPDDGAPETPAPAPAEMPNGDSPNPDEAPEPQRDQSPEPEMNQLPQDDEEAMDEPVCKPWGPDCDELAEAVGGNRSRYPLVLVHGFMGWDQVLWIEYFYDIPRVLREAGYTVFVPTTDPINSSVVRSQQLAVQVDQFLACTCAEKLNFIAHSQGGVDVRHLMNRMGYEDHVASLTTIATPHKGFRLADEALSGSRLGLRFLDLIAGLITRVAIGSPEDDADLRKTLRSLSKETMSQFNQDWPDPIDVPIYSFAGLTGLLASGEPVCDQGERQGPRRGDILEPALTATYALAGGFRTPNDGLIPVEDCMRGRFLGCLAADHWDQVGQALGLTDRFDHRSFYREHAQFLVDEGH